MKEFDYEHVGTGHWSRLLVLIGIDALLDRIQLQLDNITLEIKRERYRRFVEEVLDKRVK